MLANMRFIEGTVYKTHKSNLCNFFDRSLTLRYFGMAGASGVVKSWFVRLKMFIEYIFFLIQNCDT